MSIQLRKPIYIMLLTFALISSYIISLMKILHILSGRELLFGIDVAAMDTILALQEREDVEQFVVCRPHDDFLRPLRDVGISVEIVDFNKWSKWFMKRWIPRQVHRRIKTYVPDVIHCWGGKSATFIPRGSGVPALEWDANISTLEHNDTCDYYVCVSHQNAEEVKIQTRRPDCVFLSHPFGTLQQDTALSSEKFGIPADKPVILMLARMSREKGVDLLLRSAVKLDVFLLLAGDGPELETYRSFARNLGIESRVRFIGWRKDRSALLELADILVIPSRRESFGAVMPEAWYKGVPVVAMEADGPRQYINHGVNGMLCKIEDVDGLAKTLRVVLENADLRERLITNGKRTYETKFSKEVVISQLLKIYEEIIHRGVIRNQ